MCEGMGDLGLAFLMIFVAIISTIFSPIAFIGIAKFKGKMILISALFLLIFGWIPNLTLSRLSVEISIHVLEAIAHILVLINIEHILFNIYEHILRVIPIHPITIFYIIIFFIIFFPFCFIVTLYGILGYVCKKWRIKNNIPFNHVLEKDALVIMMAFLVCNVIIMKIFNLSPCTHPIIFFFMYCWDVFAHF